MYENTEPIRAGKYRRLSDDKLKGTADEGMAVERQDVHLDALAVSLGWPVLAAYEDNDVSATNGAHRAGFEQMLEDVRTGRINAVLCYDQDRLVRKLVELEKI